MRIIRSVIVGAGFACAVLVAAAGCGGGGGVATKKATGGKSSESNLETSVIAVAFRKPLPDVESEPSPRLFLLLKNKSRTNIVKIYDPATIKESDYGKFHVTVHDEHGNDLSGPLESPYFDGAKPDLNPGDEMVFGSQFKMPLKISKKLTFEIPTAERDKGHKETFILNVGETKTISFISNGAEYAHEWETWFHIPKATLHLSKWTYR